MSTRYMIYDKYAYALGEGVRELSRGNRIHIDAARLALRLALDELAESISPILPTLSTENDRQRHEFERRQINSQLRIGELEQEINSLYGWLAEHMPDATLVPASTAGAVLAVLDKYRLSIEALEKEAAELRSQIAQLDADNAALIRRNKELADELRRSQDHTAPANGAAANPPYVLPDDLPLWAQPQALDGLDSEATDWWIGCAAGRHTWRTVPKPVQLRMVRHVLSFGPESGAMKMTDFDAIKPDWMPSSGSHTKTLGLSWQQLNDWRVEL